MEKVGNPQPLEPSTATKVSLKELPAGASANAGVFSEAPARAAHSESDGTSGMEISPLRRQRPGTASGAPFERPVGSGAIARTDGGSMGGAKLYQPIQSLNPYQHRWVIRGRVTHRGQLRRYQNQRGEGFVFSFELTDNSGSITVTSFQEVASRLNEKVQVGKVLSISKASLKLANSKFTTTSSEYDMTLDQNSEVEEVPDDGSVSKITFKLVKIGALQEVPNQSVCDVVGIVKDVGDIQQLHSRTTGQPLSKRTVTLIDDSLKTVSLTLWNDVAENLVDSAEGHPVLLCRSVRRGEFNGVSLDGLRSSDFELNPDLAEAHALRGWYDSMNGLVTATPVSGTGSGRSQERKLIRDARNEEGRQAQLDKASYFTCRATIKFIQRQRLFYMACPETNKKVVLISPGRYRCDATDKEYDHCNYRYTLSLNIHDSSDGIWCSAFDEAGQLIFGKSAKELNEIQETDPGLLDSILYEAQLSTLIWRIRAKLDSFRDEQRVKYTVMSCEQLDPVSEGRLLLDEIRSYL